MLLSHAQRNALYACAMASAVHLACSSQEVVLESLGSSVTTDMVGSTSLNSGEPTTMIDPTETTVLSTSTSTETTAEQSTSSGGTETNGQESVCGDGIVDGFEGCDDGNLVDGDACTNVCTIAACGDGVKANDEACDDGNPDDLDGCSNTCALPVCGDGVAQGGETCDEGVGTVECDADCTSPECGDGLVNGLAGELCDDGNLNAGDGCSKSCEPTEIVSIGVGGDHTCVAFKNGNVRCWGQGEYGAVCNGETTDLGDNSNELPVANVDTNGGYVAQVSSGGLHSCVRLDNGNVECWGYGIALGYGDSENRCDSEDEVPPAEVDVGTSVLDVAAGGLHSCAVVTGDKVRCWGYGLSGQLGYGEPIYVLVKPKKLDVLGIDGAARLALGSQHTCVLGKQGDVHCWGNNEYGQLGLGHNLNVGDKPGQMPPPALKLGGSVSQISAGAYHNCVVLTNDKTVRCWGYGVYGQLGDGVSEPGHFVGDEEGEMPPAPVNLGGDVRQVAAGYRHTCALLETGSVKCWGYAGNGSLGYGNMLDIDLPGEFPPKDVLLGGDAVLLVSGAGYQDSGQSTCALLADMSLRCWGRNDFGKLGYGNQKPVGDDETPSDVGPVPF